MRNGLLSLAMVASLVGCSEPEHGAVGLGDAMPALDWEGYVNEDADGLSLNKPFIDYGTADLAASGRRYALLHTAESF